ncbi:12641_t:CDS:2, partial [Dentiscutata erythropus]
ELGVFEEDLCEEGMFKTLKKEFPDCEIYLSEVHKATAKFYCEKQKDISNDTTSLYKYLLRKKKEDSSYNIILNDNTIKTLKNIMSLELSTNVQTTSRVESYNAQIKQLVLNSNVSLIELANALETYINEETLFSEVDKALSHFFTSVMLKVQCIEVKSCLNYQASSITKAELTRYQEPKSDTMQFVKDDEDVMQVSVNYMLKNIDISNIEDDKENNLLARISFQNPKRHKAKGRPK